MPNPLTIAPGRFACVYCNQTFHFSSDLDDHACPMFPANTNAASQVEDVQYSPVSPSAPSAPSAVENSPAAKSAKDAKEEPALLPCPCCGGEAILADAPGGLKFCVCPACGLQTGSHQTEADAAEVWHRRPSLPAVNPKSVGLEPLLKLLGPGGQTALGEWIAMRRAKRFPVTKRLIEKWGRFMALNGPEAFIAALIHSTTEEYRALVPAPREAQAPKAAKKGADHARGF